MRVALVVPEATVRVTDAIPPFNLGYLASYLRKCRPDITIKIVDGTAKQDVKLCLIQFNPDIIGITAVTPQALDAYALAKWIRKVFPNALLVIGGIHASSLPEEASEHVDVVVVGEGEKALVEIVENWLYGNPQQKIMIGKPILNLDEIPSPAWDLMDLNFYFGRGYSFPFGLKAQSKVIGLITSRGCPYRCPFCYNSFRSTPVRYFSAERVATDIEYFVKNYDVHTFSFMDDEFAINKSRLQQIIKLISDKGLLGEFIFVCNVRAKSMTFERLALLKKLGCYTISCGVENCVQRMLNFLKDRTTTIRDIEKALSNAEKMRILVAASIIYGSPTETLAEMKETWRWIEHHEGIKLINLCIMTPYPRTRIHELCVKKGLLPEKLDYGRLIMTEAAENTYLVSAVPDKYFSTFIRDARRMSWLLSSCRLIRVQSEHKFRDYLRLMKVNTFWWVALFHFSKTVFYSRQAFAKVSED